MTSDQDTSEWLREVQETTDEWRRETLEGETNAHTQAAHTAVEAGELVDLLVKGSTYTDGGDVFAVDDEVVKEAGDVVVAHLGTMTELGLDVSEYEHAPRADTHEPLDAAMDTMHRATMLYTHLPDMGRAESGTMARAFCFDLLNEHADALSTLGLSLEECVEAALQKNGARDWAEHQDEATGR